LVQVKMIENALTIGARTVGQAMTPYELMQMVAADTRLDAKAIADIVKMVRLSLPTASNHVPQVFQCD
jgi:CBS domain containing-hemolysin-like protein